jgi:AAA+ superfamily predicted ATPase
MIVAATNHPEAPDAAILRRLPFKAAFERPDQATRVQLVALFLKQRPALRFAIPPAQVAALLDGLSHADATEVMREAANLRALENGRAQRHDAVTAFDLERARGRVVR